MYLYFVKPRFKEFHASVQQNIRSCFAREYTVTNDEMALCQGFAGVFVASKRESLLVATARSLGGQYVSLCSTNSKVCHKTNPKRNYTFTFFSDTKRGNPEKAY